MLEQSFRRLFPDHDWFVDNIFVQNKNNGVDHLRAILGLAELYSSEALIAAFEAANQFNTYTHRFIRGLLEMGGATKQQSASAALNRPQNSFSQPTLFDNPQQKPEQSISLTGGLNIYQQILEAKR